MAAAAPIISYFIADNSCWSRQVPGHERT